MLLESYKLDLAKLMLFHGCTVLATLKTTKVALVRAAIS